MRSDLENKAILDLAKKQARTPAEHWKIEQAQAKLRDLRELRGEIAMLQKKHSGVKSQ